MDSVSSVDPSSARKTFPRKPLIWMGVITFAFAIATLFVLTRDIPPIDDSDLAVTPKAADPAQNPYPEIRSIEISDEDAESIGTLYRAYTAGLGYDESELDRLLGSFSETLDRLDRYSRMTDWVQDQELRIDTEVPHLSQWMTLAKLRRLEIQEDLRNGEETPALAKSLSLIRFGMRFQEARGGLIQTLTGFSIVAIGQVELVGVIDTRALEEAELNQLARELDALEFDRENFADTLRAEYQVQKTIIEDIVHGKVGLSDLTGDSGSGSGTAGISNSLVFKENQTRKMFADAYRQMIAEVPMTRVDAPRLSTRQMEALSDKNRVLMFLSGNAIGRILYAIAIPAIDTTLDNLALQQARHELIRLRVALERHRLITGDWPAELETLVPEFIDSVPIDPIDGAPLRYNPAGGIIYSIGRDLRDDGGNLPRKPGQLSDREELIITLEPKADEI